MKIKLVILIAICMITNIYAEKITMGIGEFPPYISENMKGNGVLVEMVKEAMVLEGVEVEVRIFPWNRAYMMTLTGDIDMSPGWVKTEEREKQFYFSEKALISGEVVLFYNKKKQIKFEKYEDLKNYKIGITRGYNYGAEFTEFIEKNKNNVKIYEASDDLTNFNKLLLGRIDAFPCEFYVGKYILNKALKDRQGKNRIEVNLKTIAASPGYVIVSKKSKNGYEIIDKFNRGFSKLIISGKYDDYLKKMLDGYYDVTDEKKK